jgi:hypothetical protein
MLLLASAFLGEPPKKYRTGNLLAKCSRNGAWFIRLAAPQSARMNYTPAPEKSKDYLSRLLPFVAR